MRTTSELTVMARRASDDGIRPDHLERELMERIDACTLTELKAFVVVECGVCLGRTRKALASQLIKAVHESRKSIDRCKSIMRG